MVQFAVNVISLVVQQFSVWIELLENLISTAKWIFFGRSIRVFFGILTLLSFPINLRMRFIQVRPGPVQMPIL